MKKVMINKKVAEEAKEREKRWKELRSFMESNEGNDKKHRQNTEIMTKPEQKVQANQVDLLLQGIGLDKYCKVMKENGIDDLEILQELNEQHLEQMGLVLGHRIKLLKKIKDLANGPGKNFNTEPSPETKHKVPIQQEFGVQHEFAIKQQKPLPAKNPARDIQQAPKNPMGEIQQALKILEVKQRVHENTGEKKEIATDTAESDEKSQPAKPSSLSAREFKIPINTKIAERIEEKLEKQEKPESKEPLIILAKPPIANKQMTVGKTISTYQPTSHEAEKTIKLSEMIPSSNEEIKKEQIKWDNFTYVPYKPSQEIQEIQEITKPKTSSRPLSASKKPEPKLSENFIEENKEKFDVAGWDN